MLGGSHQGRSWPQHPAGVGCPSQPGTLPRAHCPPQPHVTRAPERSDSVCPLTDTFLFSASFSLGFGTEGNSSWRDEPRNPTQGGFGACISAWSTLGCGQPGSLPMQRGAGAGRSPPATVPSPAASAPLPEPGAGSFHGQGEQARLCPLPACAAEQGRGEPICCPTNSRWSWVISPLVVSQ